MDRAGTPGAHRRTRTRRMNRPRSTPGRAARPLRRRRHRRLRSCARRTDAPPRWAPRLRSAAMVLYPKPRPRMGYVRGEAAFHTPTSRLCLAVRPRPARSLVRRVCGTPLEALATDLSRGCWTPAHHLRRQPPRSHGPRMGSESRTPRRKSDLRMEGVNRSLVTANSGHVECEGQGRPSTTTPSRRSLALRKGTPTPPPGNPHGPIDGIRMDRSRRTAGFSNVRARNRPHRPRLTPGVRLRTTVDDRRRR